MGLLLLHLTRLQHAMFRGRREVGLSVEHAFLHVNPEARGPPEQCGVL